MSAVLSEDLILAAITTNFKQFNLIMTSGVWKMEYHKDCIEIIGNVADLKHALRKVVGDARADELVAKKYKEIFPKG